jgi:hypothetical protein
VPAFKSCKMVVAVDMAGCPNRCRHCWLGSPPNRRVTEETLRRVVGQFRAWMQGHHVGTQEHHVGMQPGDAEPAIRSLGVATWYREPDFAPNYRQLWELEKELSDPGEARRFELLSIWRLARDEGYAAWAREIGTEACQISLFGLEGNTDYFCRRRGAFRDSLLATERLLQAGIRPRWQVFLTERLVPELDALVDLIRSLNLDLTGFPKPVRSADASSDPVRSTFEVFVHGVSPDGEGFNLEPLRPTVDVLSRIPPYLVEKTLQHAGKATLEECLGKAEADWLPELAEADAPFAAYPDTLAFMVTPELDVYSNLGEPMPWWRLGNLDVEGLDTIMRRYVHDEAPGLWANFHVPVSELARAYGRPESRLLYERDDLITRWLRMWAEDRWAK